MSANTAFSRYPVPEIADLPDDIRELVNNDVRFLRQF